MAKEHNWKRIAREFRTARGSMGSFMFHLCNAITIADITNLARLRQSFPELVKELKENDTSN